MLDFCDIARKQFHFLETEFDCHIESSREEDWGGEVVYCNSTTGVKLLYEYSCAFVFVLIYKLIDGKMIENPNPVTKDSVIACFDFNDTLTEDVKMKPAYEYGSNSEYYDEDKGLSNYVKEFAGRLSEFGEGILRGDFSIVPVMEKIIKKRARGVAPNDD